MLFYKGGIFKITSYLADIFCKTGQALLTLFINGEVINEDNVKVAYMVE